MSDRVIDFEKGILLGVSEPDKMFCDVSDNKERKLFAEAYAFCKASYVHGVPLAHLDRFHEVLLELTKVVEDAMKIAKPYLKNIQDDLPCEVAETRPPYGV